MFHMGKMYLLRSPENPFANGVPILVITWTARYPKDDHASACCLFLFGVLRDYVSGLQRT